MGVALPIENAFIKYWVEEDILFGEYKHVDVNSLAIAMECVKDRLLLANGNSYPYLLDARKLRSINKEARDYFASEESEKCMVAGAILVDSSITTIIGNFFLKINKPSIPTRIFTDKEKALDWLRKFLN